MHWIFAENSGNKSSSLLLFHFRSLVSKSETRRSLASSSIGPYGLICSVGEIQESFHTLVVKPLPIAFPIFFANKSLPCRTLLQPWEQDEGAVTSRSGFCWQYLPLRILASRQEGFVRIRQAFFARRAWLNIWTSQNPRPPCALGLVRFVQETKHSFFFHHLHTTKI